MWPADEIDMYEVSKKKPAKNAKRKIDLDTISYSAVFRDHQENPKKNTEKPLPAALGFLQGLSEYRKKLLSQGVITASKARGLPLETKK